MRKILVLTLLLALPLWAQVQLSGTVQVSGTTLICATPSAGTVATPTASPGAGTYSSTQSVTLSTSTSGATICYTTDGTTPTASAGSCTHGTTYSTAISVASSLTIEAIGTLASYTNSGILTAAYTITSSGGTATVIVCPNASQTGNNANCAPSDDPNGIPQVLAFGDQGTDTASMAIPISVNNCSNSAIANCTGTGAVTLDGTTPFSIAGTNASDFTISDGTCSAGQTISSGDSCSPTITFTPTASAGTNETATLTVTDNGTTTTQTLPLTGTSATVTDISTSSCPSSLTGGTYQLTADISCAGIAFTVTNSGGAIDINLNGRTITYGTTASASAVNAIEGAVNPSLTVHNGTITAGTAANTYGYGRTSGHYLSSPIGFSGYTTPSSFFNLTFNYGTNTQYADAIETQGANMLIHDITINNSAVGTCASVGCRDEYQATPIYQSSASGDASGGTEIYNVVTNGGPQGAIQVAAKGATVAYNYLNPGNATGNNSNDFCIYGQSSSGDIYKNICMVPLTASSNSRGYFLSGEGGTTGETFADNTVISYETSTNTEYGGCEGGGAYGLQIDDSPVGPNTLNGNVISASALDCSAEAFRVSETAYATNVSENSTYTATRQSGAVTCAPIVDTGIQPGCAYAISFNVPTGFTSTNDTFTGDSGDVYFDVNGAENITLESPTFNKGSNLSDFSTIVARNGSTSEGGGPVSNFHIVDATFNTGTGPTDTDIPFPAPGTPTQNMGAVSVYIDWTQNMTVSKASGGAASGALVTFTDTLGNPYTCTTNISGTCSVAVTQYRDNNDTAENGVEDRNPYGLTVSLSGCTTNTTSGLTISATGSRSITLSGC